MWSPSSHDAAVSPVIGTILLVALTVVFIAIAAVVAMGMAGGLFETKQVGVTLEPYGIAGDSERGVSVQIYGGADAGDLVSLTASLNGPELVYRETGKSSVEDPVVGTGYRFKAEDRETISSIREFNNMKLPVTLKTNHILSMPRTTYLVTVTGKFSDGTEQVLLVQKVTLPAISEQGNSYTASNGIVIIPDLFDSESGGYPGHGFTLSVPKGMSGKEMETWANSVKFKTINPITNEIVTLKVTDNNLTMSPNKDENDNIVSYSFDINPSASGDGWKNTPFPEEKYWALGALTGTITAGEGTSNSISVDGVKVEERVNYFDNPELISGTLKIVYRENQNKLTTYWEDMTIDSEYGEYIPRTDERYYCLSTNPGNRITIKDEIIDAPSNANVEAYAKVKVGNTYVWYKVASVPVSELRQQYP